MSRHWWNHIPSPVPSLPTEQHHFLTTCAIFSLLNRGLSGDRRPLIEFAGNGKHDLEFTGLTTRVAELGGHLVLQAVSTKTEHGTDHTYVWDDAICHVQEYASGALAISFVGLEGALSCALRDLVSEFYHEPESDSVYVLVRTAHGFDIKVGARVGLELERGNYVQETLDQYDRVVCDLDTATPFGRLVLLDGPPGTGKTFFVRSLIHAVPRATFLLVQAELVRHLDGPDFLPLFLKIRHEEERTGPLVLVIEDADECLVPRRLHDNMSSVRALLNYTDGILGAAFDLRIIATTNAKKMELEPALLRPGRLLSRIDIGILSRAHSQEIFRRLTGKETTAPMSTLAEAYGEAREIGWKPPALTPSDTDRSRARRRRRRRRRQGPVRRVDEAM